MDLPQRAAAAAVVLPLLSAAVGAQELPEDDYFGELPVVLSPARIAQTTVESPVSFSVLDEEAIRAIGARDVAELFRQLPGFQVGYFTGDRPVVTYHGLADQFARRMQVLIDGRSVYVPIYGGVPWQSLPLAIEDIVRIEVIRGPNAASFGPNAFSGVISISTRHASEDSGWLTSLNSGDRDWQRGLVRYSGNAGDLDYRVTMAYEEHDGFVDVHDGKLARLVTGRLDYSLNARDTLMLQAGLNTGSIEIGEAGQLGDPEREIQPSYAFYHLRWERNWSIDQALVLQYYANRYRTVDNFPINTVVDVPPPVAASTFVDFDTDSTREDFELQYNFAPHDNLRLVVGGSVRRDSVSSRGLFGSDDTLDNDVYRAFVHAEWALTAALNANAGVMWEDNEITGADQSPKIGLLYRLGPNHSVRTGVSHATRTPVFLEDQANSFFVISFQPPAPLPPFQQIQYNLFRDGGLKPEEITSWELGYRYTGRDLDFDVRLFVDRVTDIILQEEVEPFPPDTFDGDVLTFNNHTDADIEGIEAQLDMLLNERLRLLASLSYAQAETEGDNANQDIERSVPTWTAGVLTIYRLGRGSFISADYNYVEDLDWVDSRDAFTTRKLDLQYARNFRLGNQGAALAINLENILGNYTEYQSENVVRPGGYMRFTMTFR